MKKLNLFLISFLMIIATGVMTACTWKNVEATFKEEEVVVSLQENVKLDDYLTVKGVDKSQVEYVISNPEIFELNSRGAVATKSGKSYVYATYKNNSLAKMLLVSKKQFLAPTEFSLSDTGLLTWNEVANFFENEKNPTYAKQYLVSGTLTVYSSANPNTIEKQESFNKIVSGNSVQLTENGEYRLTVEALSDGYFDDGEPSKEQKVYLGYMPQLEKADLTWNASTGVLSWSAVEGASYQVSLDGHLLGVKQNSTSKDLSSFLENASVGKHKLVVVVFDSENKKMATKSEVVEVEKFAIPSAEFVYSSSNGGQLRIKAMDNVDSFKLFFEDESGQVIEKTLKNNGQQIDTSVDGLQTGVYTLTVQAVNENGLYFHSDSKLIGKVLKLGKVQIEGVGENEENGRDFNLLLKGSSYEFDTRMKVYGLGDPVDKDGLVSGQDKANLSLRVSEAGNYEVEAVLMSKSRQVTVGQENVFVLNSDISEKLSFVKLPEFQVVDDREIRHSYLQNKSILSFQEVEGAVAYDLYFNDGTDFVFVKTTTETQFEFDDKIENVFESATVEGKDVYNFKIVAKTNSDTLAINSSAEKSIGLLSAPVSVGSGNSTNKTYRWSEVNNADTYSVEIYTLDKALYQQSKDEGYVDVAGLECERRVVNTAEVVFDSVGYYYAKIWAISEDEDNFISSVDCLEEVFFIAQQLELSTVKFGYDDAYINDAELTASTGYFVSVADVENAQRFEFSVGSSNNATLKKVVGEDTIYLLSENFEVAGEGIELSVIAHAEDETLYPESDAKVITVKKLNSVVFASDIVVDDLTSTVSVKPKDGVSEIKIWESDTSYITAPATGNVSFDIAGKQNFKLQFTYIGSRKVGQFYEENNGYVYLNSKTEEYSFRRIEAPTNLKYYDGSLTFDHTELPPVTKYYVLDVVCTDLAGNETVLTLKFDTMLKAIYDGQEHPLLLPSSTFITVGASVVNINFARILSIVKSFDALPGVAEIYNQSVSVKFAVYAYQVRNDGQDVVLSSTYATLEEGAGNILEVEKMHAPELEFSYQTTQTNKTTDYNLIWNDANSGFLKNSETEYDIYKMSSGDDFESATLVKSVKGAFNYIIPDEDLPLASNTYYTYFVKAKNKYYLESASSNLVKIYKLRPLANIVLQGDSLIYSIKNTETPFAEGVEVTINGEKSENANGMISVVEAGEYVFKVVGKTAVESLTSDGHKVLTYYINSDTSTWQLKEMSELAPTDSQVLYNSGLVSWNTFADGQALDVSYYVIFKDSQGKTVTVVTDMTSLNLNMVVSLFDKVGELAAGQISVGVSAFIESPYQILAGGNVYFALNTTLHDGNVEDNHFNYQPATNVVKLKTPEVVELEFDYDELKDAQNADLVVSFVGNYGDEAQINVYLGDQLIIGNKLVPKADEKYTFSIERDLYNNGFDADTTKTLKISVVSSDAFPSSAGTIDILRALPVKNVEFIDGDLGYSSKISIEFNASEGEEDYNYTKGGVVLQIDYTPTGAEAKTEYYLVNVDVVDGEAEVDLTSYLDENISVGGRLKVTAYVNNHANVADGRYVVASPTIKQSAEYRVLSTLQEGNLIRKSGGFVITSENGDQTTYFIECQGYEYEIDSSDEFYFEFPEHWGNETYVVSIVARKEGFVESSIAEIEFTLNRIDSVNEVTLQRKDEDNLSELTLSWDEIPDATGYILKMFAKEDENKENLLYQYESTKAATAVKVELTVEEIFGHNFEDVSNELLFMLQNDLEVVFDLTTIGNATYNNSHVYTFNATIKGSVLTETDVVLDEFGNIILNSVVGQRYLYRIIGSDGVQLQSWQEVEADAEKMVLELEKGIDRRYLISEGRQFNVEVIILGTATINPESTSNEYEFMLDSIPMTTYGTNVTFVVNDSIIEVGYYAELPSSLAFTMVSSQAFDKVYVGTTEDAILRGEVVGIDLDEQFGASDGIATVFSYSIPQLFDLLKSSGIEILPAEDKVELYFWSFRNTAVYSDKYVISNYYQYTIGYETLSQFEGISKLGTFEGIEGVPEGHEDFADTYASFAENDDATVETLGIFVKVTQISAGQEQEIEVTSDEPVFSTIKFFSKEQIVNRRYFEDKLSINLTRDVFEDFDLLNMTGRFAVEFSMLKIKKLSGVDGETTQFIATPWLAEYQGKKFEFERLAEVQNFRLEDGNLYWNRTDEAPDNYYVYFAEEVDGEALGNNYTYHITTNNYFEASAYAGTKAIYYLSVQAVSKDLYILSSKRTFITKVEDEEYVPKAIYKNQMSMPLEIEHGALKINWEEEEFYKLIMGLDEYKDYTYAQAGKALGETVFTSPFTFSLKSLLSGDVVVRLRFNSINSGTQGMRKVFDIDARYLLADLRAFCNQNELNIDERLTAILNSTFESSAQTLIRNFRDEFVNADVFGVGVRDRLFDDYFEGLQLGDYQLDYCLLGGSETLSSVWYTFENDNGENCVYVNAEPSVIAQKVQDQTDKSINTYRILIRMSDLYVADGSTVKAEHYVMRIKNDAGTSHVFEIQQGGSGYVLTAYGDNSKTVSVYKTDSAGTIDASGEYLMFYLNINNGDSLLGVFGEEIEKRTYNLQIYAVGNEYSLSSKSQSYTITFFGFGKDLTVNNGEITWSPQINHPTSVIYKSHDGLYENLTTVSGTSAIARYSLDGLGAGLYDYVKFVMIGEIRSNTILVDSEVYVLNNVYKLAEPTLKNDRGYLAINERNMAVLENCYLDNGVYNYNIYNNISTDYMSIIIPGQGGNTVYYEPGTTNFDKNNSEDLLYKETETLANEFKVASLGTSVGLKTTNGDALGNYHIRTILCEEDETKSIAIKSSYATIKAAMMDMTTKVYVQNGVLKWDAVTGKTGVNNYTINAEPDAKVVYKITVAQYREGVSGESDTNVEKELFFYTTNTEFDFRNIKADQLKDVPEVTYLRATVQAFAAFCSEEAPASDFIQLDNGYAYGNLTFDDSEVFVLLGNGNTIKKIDRIKPVMPGSLKVSQDGELTWRYSTHIDITEQNFFNFYSFEVVDEDGKAIEGELSVLLVDSSASENVFQVYFFDTTGSMLAKEQILKVYATQGRTNVDVSIKSFAEEIKVTKLETIKTGDFTIDSKTYNETLDFSEYFRLNPTNIIDAEITTSLMSDPYRLTFDRYANKLYIIRSSDEAMLEKPFPEGYLPTVVYVEDSDFAQLKFVVRRQEAAIYNIMFSDKSETFSLQRTNGVSVDSITWDATSQQFSWAYDDVYAIKQSAEVDIVEKQYSIIGDTELFLDVDLSVGADVTLHTGDVVQLIALENGKAKISYEFAEYYISTQYLTSEFVSTNKIQLQANTLLRKIETDGEFSIVTPGSGIYYQVQNSLFIEPIYIVEARYGIDGPSQIIRTYTTTKNTFTPTIIGLVNISVKVKLGGTNLQSSASQYSDADGNAKYEEFNLFVSGRGTETLPYIIETEEQFKNIAKRMSKSEEYKSFIQYGEETSEEEQYYFVITKDIDLTDQVFSGILLPGTFDGVIDGFYNSNTAKISYHSEGVSALTTPITITKEEGHRVYSTSSSATRTDFRYATSLFEGLSSNAIIKNLKIDAQYGHDPELVATDKNNITSHSLIAGLAVKNSGKIENVELVGFENYFAGNVGGSTRLIMSYTGIASINIGGSATIKNCSVSTGMKVADGRYPQLIFVSGISYVNYALIEGCVVGLSESGQKLTLLIDCQNTADTIQAAGIVITSTGQSKIQQCENNFDIEVYVPPKENHISVYMGAIATFNGGTKNSNVNNGNLHVDNVPSTFEEETRI